MYKRFNTSSEAVSFLSEGLTKDFPDATAEIIQVIENRPRRVSSGVTAIETVLTQACGQFPMASVDYHPENQYGFVAEIRCHGEHKRGEHKRGENKRSTTFEKHKKDRPRVLVLLTRIGEREILVGSHMAPKTERQKIG